MRLWAAFVADLAVAFDPAVHCTDADEGFSLRFSEVEGQQATLEVEREQRGWSILSVGQPRNILLSWSPSEAPADAVLIARGRINELPSDLFSARQTVRAVCAPVDIDEKVLEWAKANLDSKPETDPLFDDFVLDDAESFLLGRSATYRIDPATHAVSLVDDCVGEVTHDLSDVALFEGTEISDAPGVYGTPTRRLTAELTVDWTQSSTGSANIAGRLAGITSLDPNLTSNIASFISATGGAGWSVGAVESTKVPFTLETSFIGGPYDTFVKKSEKKKVVKKTTPYFGGTVETGEFVRAIETEEEDRWEMDPTSSILGISTIPSVIFQAYRYFFTNVEMKYSVSLNRREILRSEMLISAQDSMVVEEKEADPIRFGLKDIFSNPEIDEWEQYQDYEEGDLVVYDGKVWRCNGAHTSVYFDQERDPPILRRIRDGIVKFVQRILIYWEPYTDPTLLSPETTSAFLSTPRGQLCVQHMYLRLRKEGRRRLRARHLTFTCRWQDAYHVTMRDSASITVPWGDGSAKLVSGKVVTRELTWDGEGGAMLRFEIAVSFGAASAPVGTEPEIRYAEPGYAEAGWERASDVSALADIYHVEIDEVIPRELVDVALLRSGGYACISAGVHNQSGTQITKVYDVVAAGKEITEVSVVYPTWIGIDMRPLTSSDTLIREIGGYSNLDNVPKGVDL